VREEGKARSDELRPFEVESSGVMRTMVLNDVVIASTKLESRKRQSCRENRDGKRGNQGTCARKLPEPFLNLFFRVEGCLHVLRSEPTSIRRSPRRLPSLLRSFVLASQRLVELSGLKLGWGDVAHCLRQSESRVEHLEGRTGVGKAKRDERSGQSGETMAGCGKGLAV
jgi:hypothetical protein